LKIAEFGGIENTDTFQEYVTLIFKDERCKIDTRWDRIIFTSQGERDDIGQASGPLYYFFEILAKISKLNSFGKFINVVLAQWRLLPIAKDRLEIVKDFQKQKLSDVSNQSGYLDGYQLNDLAIVYEFKSDKKIASLRYGPFNSDTDPQKHNLLTFKSDEEELKKENGLLSESLFFEECTAIDIDVFKRLNKNLEKLFKIVSLT
jgi:hypothetical protein